ncbi:hypothetical protein OGATHE_001187 [Ogataea polymorpha]|uniref:Uncharacterized protein n=1 Tax=Ogataea polymorpha TaxID=460523 RepID=A0A9P8TEK6_9ASCO|nr:hypothetical protein OGATHE_001187 [Ogataea polymorpha]
MELESGLWNTKPVNLHESPNSVKRPHSHAGIRPFQVSDAFAVEIRPHNENQGQNNVYSQKQFENNDGFLCGWDQAVKELEGGPFAKRPKHIPWLEVFAIQRGQSDVTPKCVNYASFKLVVPSKVFEMVKNTDQAQGHHPKHAHYGGKIVCPSKVSRKQRKRVRVRHHSGEVQTHRRTDRRAEIMRPGLSFRKDVLCCVLIPPFECLYVQISSSESAAVVGNDAIRVL